MPTFSIFRRSAVVLPALSLLGLHPGGGLPAVRSSPERLVAEAPIWGANNGWKGYAFLPITIHGHAATVVINLNDEGDLSLSTAALARMDVTLPDTSNTSTLDSLSIGSDVQHHVPIDFIRRPNWTVARPPAVSPVVGVVGVHFLTTHYDLLYDFSGKRVQLYAFPPYSTGTHKAWFPSGIKPSDCGRMVYIPPGAGTFTGMELRLDGHLVTGVIEMFPYGGEEAGQGDEKMNRDAFQAMGLTEQSPRVQPVPDLPAGTMNQVTNVHITVGSHNFWTGSVKIFPSLDAQEKMKANTPIMLLNLTTIHHVVVFNSVSDQLVCLSTP